MSSKKRDRFLRHFRASSKPQSCEKPASVSTSAASPGQIVQPDADPVQDQAQGLALVSLSREDFAEVAPEPFHGAASEQSLWARAYSAVATSDPAILRPFEQIYLAKDNSFQDDRGLQSALEKALQERDDKLLVLSIAGKSVHVRQVGEKIIKFVIWSKDWVSCAVKQDPHAALAWISVSLLLPLILRPSEQNTAMLDGLETITELLSLYKIRLDRYHVRGVANPDFEDSIVQIFAKIIEYQARCIRHLNRTSLNRLAHNIGGSDDWVQSLESIQAKEKHISALTGLLDRQEDNAILNAQLSGTATQVSLQQTIVRVLNDWREEQHRTKVSKGMQACLHALSSAYREEKDFNKERVPNTCGWLLQSDELAKWRDTDGPSVLWISADPGCGKSVLSRCLIDEKQLNSSIIGSVTCYFFFKDGLAGRVTMADALAAILHQLFCTEPALLAFAVSSYQKHGSQIRSRPSELWDILIDAAQNAVVGEIIIVIDALDECESDECSKLLRAITNIFRKTSGTRPNLKFCLTSRPYTTIEMEMTRMHESTTYIRVPGEDKLEAIGREIDLVITAEVPSRLPTLSHSQQETVAEMLKSKHNRTYLWLYLVLNVIQDQVAAVTTDAELSSLVNKLPHNVKDAYAAILHRSPSPEKARTLLQIVVAARIPLTVQEVIVALILAGKDCADLESIPNISLPSSQTTKSNLKNICGLLLSVSNDRVYLLHETVRDFLVDTSLLNNDTRSDWQHFGIIEADAVMVRVCILVLNALDAILPADLLVSSDDKAEPREFSIVKRDIDQYLATYPSHLSGLLLYAADFWYVHAEDGLSIIQDSSFLRLSCNLLDIKHPSCIFCYRTWVKTQPVWELESTQYTPLTLAAFFNLAGLIEQLINDGHNVNYATKLNEGGGAPKFGNALCAAASLGHISAVKTLVKLGSDVNEQSGSYGSPLNCAQFDEQIFCYLIQNHADINAKVVLYGTVLGRAVCELNPEAVRMCIRFGANDFDSGFEGLWTVLKIKEEHRFYHNTELPSKWCENVLVCLNLLNDAAARNHPHRRKVKVSDIVSDPEMLRCIRRRRKELL